jgi:phosphohistidine phosphatase
MIRLYLVRHAIAEESAANDGWRTLTEKGRRRFQRTAHAFGRNERLDLLLTSPLVRAVQTAEILAGEVKHRDLRVLEELGPGHTVAALLGAVAKAAGKAGSVALVGHDPQLTDVLAALTHVAAARLEFRKGAIVRLDVSALPQAKAVEARWWLKPRSGTKRKGLPLKGEPKAKTPKKPAAKAKPPKAPPAKKAPARKAAPKPRPAAAPPAKPPTRSPKPVAAPLPASPPARQTFMGSPRTADAAPAAPENTQPADSSSGDET